MNYRKLRIAWSVTWGILAVLLCLLWMRSYWWCDSLYTSSNPALISLDGRIQVGGHVHIQNSPALKPKFLVLSKQLIVISVEVGTSEQFLPDLSLRGSFTKYGLNGLIPYWFLVLLTATLTTIPWLRLLPRRFSLRTLLIAITVIAVVLGLVVWLARTRT